MGMLSPPSWGYLLLAIVDCSPATGSAVIGTKKPNEMYDIGFISCAGYFSGKVLYLQSKTEVLQNEPVRLGS